MASKIKKSAPALNRGLPSKIWLVGKCKQCEIYRRMCDCYGETGFSQKMFTNMGLPLRVNGVETHRLSGKENIQRTATSKEGYADNLLRHERTHHYRFP